MTDYSKKTIYDGDPKILSIWHKAILKLFDFKNKSVVDIGCGSGSFLLAIKNEAVKTLGIDPNKINCQKATEHNLTTINDYPENIKNHDSEFDIASSFEVIEHLYTHENIIKSMEKMLKSGGLGIITTPNAFNIIRTLVFVFKQEHHDSLLDPTRSSLPEHIRLWSYNMAKRICNKESDLRVERIYGIGLIFNKLHIFKNRFMIKYFSQHLVICIRKDN